MATARPTRAAGPPYPLGGVHGVDAWTKHDFAVNRSYWQAQGPGAAMPIRLANLADLIGGIEASKICYWVHGKTLAGILRTGTLAEDHDDDLGIFSEDRARFEQAVLPRLRAQGFTVIRDTPDMLSLFRAGRYADVCVFRPRGRRRGYGHKWFPARFFRDFETRHLEGIAIRVPTAAARLLRYAYSPLGAGRLRFAIAGRANREWLGRLPDRVVHKVLESKAPRPIKYVSAAFHPRVRLVELDELAFLALRIEPDDSFNWRWRGPHLQLVTDGGRLRRIGDILEWLRQPGVAERVRQLVRDTDTSVPFTVPANLDHRFWNTGNNFFANCILYGFRRGVHAYHQANAYISSGASPPLFSGAYYAARSPMRDDEVSLLLREKPLEVTDGAVTGGKHRAFAMLGRLLEGKPYLPIRAYIWTSRSGQ